MQFINYTTDDVQMTTGVVGEANDVHNLGRYTSKQISRCSDILFWRNLFLKSHMK